MDSPRGAADPAAERRRALETLLRTEIPLSAQMDVAVDSITDAGLWLSMPLAPNRNPHQTAFAGSLNALCTLAGWAMTHLLLEQVGEAGSIVIRRSSIKYHLPVESPRVAACCLPPREADWDHFVEMLPEKGQAKLDLVVEIAGDADDRPAVLFAGNYVVTGKK
ncbi:putative thioesterase [Botrimarina colliarenosi]|uniref:Putative thioesterase n=1 Tax=Botrimarina colliarenosi TaxID=2528001 RepID=A0A5C6A784_9BACT|nr:YiiD C-terminal domain-containing protein [Botrimarina colliarenosi]TWT95250.1 putative thioesterase [Botrimarina colliarenosi]